MGAHILSMLAHDFFMFQYHYKLQSIVLMIVRLFDMTATFQRLMNICFVQCCTYAVITSKCTGQQPQGTYLLHCSAAYSSPIGCFGATQPTTKFR